MTDLALAITHHLLVFGLAGVLAAEIAMVRRGLDANGLRRLGIIDAHYGALAGLILVVGFLRVFYGLKGPAYYLPNPVFWAKVGAFVVVGLLSITPTVLILRWRRTAKADPGFAVPDAQIAAVRRFLLAEITVFALIPVFAAAMARGMGL